mmetsp:Transcript_8860/g.27515  ORF Transcript_8860/g.27515 Transcript_8860/m.27515 type:complete len:213 (-) Transcript_8860:137-775(-)
MISELLAKQVAACFTQPRPPRSTPAHTHNAEVYYLPNSLRLACRLARASSASRVLLLEALTLELLEIGGGTLPLFWCHARRRCCRARRCCCCARRRCCCCCARRRCCCACRRSASVALGQRTLHRTLLSSIHREVILLLILVECSFERRGRRIEARHQCERILLALRAGTGHVIHMVPSRIVDARRQECAAHAPLAVHSRTNTRVVAGEEVH